MVSTLIEDDIKSTMHSTLSSHLLKLSWRSTAEEMVNWKGITRSMVNWKKAFQPSTPDGVVKKNCLCEVLLVTLWLSRLFGIAPIGWRHPKNRQFFREDGQCEFYVSKGWTLYSIIICIGYNALFISSPEFHSGDVSKWSEILMAVNLYSYYIFATILSLIATLRAKALCRSLNDVSEFLRKGLLCTHAKQTVLSTSRLGFIVILLQLTIQFGAMLFMSWNDKFTSHFSLSDVINRVVQNVPFMFYYLFTTICAIFVGLFMCFDTTMLQTLNYEEFKMQLKVTGELRLNDTEDEGSSGYNTMKIVRCRGRHMNVVKHASINSTVMDDLDQLRRLHECIRDSLVCANDAFNPQIAIHLFIVLTVLVMHLYSVILYTNIPDKTPDQFTDFCINWLFVIVHTIGLLMFLLSCQGIRASVREEI